MLAILVDHKTVQIVILDAGQAALARHTGLYTTIFSERIPAVPGDETTSISASQIRWRLCSQVLRSRDVLIFERLP